MTVKLTAKTPPPVCKQTGMANLFSSNLALSGFWLSGSQFSDFVKMDKVYQPDKREGVSAKINLRSYFEHYRDNREGEFVVVLS